ARARRLGDPGRLMDARQRERAAPAAATIWPIGFAIGVAALLVGLVVNPEVIASLGGAIALLAGFRWIRGEGRAARRTPPPPRARPAGDADRYTRGRFLSRVTLAFGGIITA